MLKKLQLKIDTRDLKCCFSSIMKHKIVLSLGALLTALFINSCASNGGGAIGNQAGRTGGDFEFPVAPERPVPVAPAAVQAQLF